jgi:hypothetical protein
MTLNFNIETGFTKKDDGFVVVEMKCKDNFTDDKYILSGIIKEGILNFSVERNNKTLKEIAFNKEKDKFLKNVSESVGDYDFVEEFSKKHLEGFHCQISEFIEKINSSMISKGEIFEGYKNKMRRMAGIIDSNKHIK